MRLDAVRKIALSLPEVTEEPHHEYGSFRVKGKIFVTFPPQGERIHFFLADQEREVALSLNPEFVEKLLWGGKVVGVRVNLARAKPSSVKTMLEQAWLNKAPKAVQAKYKRAVATGGGCGGAEGVP
jgi:hypothetical protein